MKKRILALLMTLVMVFGMNTTFLANPTGETGSATVDNEVEMPEKVKVSIDENWNVVVDHVMAGASSVYYYFTVYKDDVRLTSFGTGYISDADGTKYYNMSEQLDGEGEYYVEASASYCYDGEYKYIYGTTDTVEYVMPEKRLDAPANVKITDGVLTFDTVEGVSTYRINYYITYKEDGYESMTSWQTVILGDQGEIDLKSNFGGHRSDVDIYATVTALSNDVKNIYHSEESEKVGPYEHRVEEKTATVTWSTTDLGTVNVEKLSDQDAYVDGNLVAYKGDLWAGYTYFWGRANEAVSQDLSHALRYQGAGEYTVKLTAYEWDMDTQTYTRYVGEDTFTYAPATTLATPANVSLSEDNVFTFDYTADAEEYMVYFRIEYTGTGEAYEYTESLLTKEDGKTQGSVDLSLSWIVDEIAWLKEDGDDVVVKVGVRALTDDLANVATSEAAWVTVYEKKATAEEVKDALDKVLADENATSSTKRDVLVGASNDTVAELLKDATFVAKVAEIEAAYVTDQNITVVVPKSNVAAIDASKITVVGAGLNAKYGETVQLAVSTPATAATVPAGYKNGVQLDISLLVNGKALEDLSVPVTITMPIPAGVDTEDLVILHYHGDAETPAIITPVVNADGTMTFTVTGFSTFVVANVAKAPGTGDVSVASVCAIMLLAAAAVVVMKKRSVVK